MNSDFFSEATAGFLLPIIEYLQDSSVSEIMVNGAKEIYVEKGGKLQKTPSSFADEEELMAAVRRIAQMVGKRIDEKNHIMDARLPDGSRVHIVIPPTARRGIYMTIRKFGRGFLSMKQLVEGGAMTVPMAKFLNLCIAVAKNILVSGGTSSGKTTLLNVVSSLIPADQRIVVIEDASELNLQQEHVLPLETRSSEGDAKGGGTSVRELVRTSLRMRPDRIVIGEVRGAEAMDLLQAMNTGHAGSLTTIHANTPLGALDRLETLSMMSDVALPWRALRSQVASAIHIVVQTLRLPDGSRKITNISEVCGLTESGNYIVHDIFVYKIKTIDAKGKMTGAHEATGVIPTFLNEAKSQGYLVDESMFK